MAKKTDRSTTARLAATKGELADCEAEVRQLNGLLIESRKANEALAADRAALMKSLGDTEKQLLEAREQCAEMDLRRVKISNDANELAKERRTAIGSAIWLRGWLIVATVVAVLGWFVAALT